jgi:hypothetical protein
MKFGAKALEESNVSGISDRIAGRKQSKTKLLSDDGGDGAEVIRPEVRGMTALEPPDPSRVDVGRLANRAEAEPGADPRTPQLDANAYPRLGCPSSTSVSRSLACRHAPTLAPGAYFGIISDSTIAG